MKKIVFAIIISASLLSCEKDTEIIPEVVPPGKNPEGTEETIKPAKIKELNGISAEEVVSIGQKLSLSTKVSETDKISIAWYANGEKISTEPTVEFIPTKNGQQSIKLELTNSAGKDSREIMFHVFRPVKTTSSKWISQLVEYRPAPGQFINKNPGNMASAEGIVGKRGMVTLGGFGGYIIFGFDHTVANNEGIDFVIHGNAFEGGSEAGAVMVAYDANGNGKADDEWFELKGSEYEKSKKSIEITYTRPKQTISAEDVTWVTSDGSTGAIHNKPIEDYHKQCYYPLFLADNPATLKFTGNMVPKNGSQDPDTGFWALATLPWGYVDNFSEDYMVQIDNDRDTERSNKFEISNAITKDGKTVILKGIDFIKVYNTINAEAGMLGETSTEVCGAISLTIKK